MVTVLINITNKLQDPTKERNITYIEAKLLKQPQTEATPAERDLWTTENSNQGITKINIQQKTNLN